MADRLRLAADGPQAWLDEHLEARRAQWDHDDEDVAGGGGGSVVTWADVIEGDALRAGYERCLAARVPPKAAATYVGGWFAGAIAEIVGFGLVGADAGFVVAPDSIRYHLHREGWIERTEVGVRALVAPGHPWAGRTDVEVVADAEAVRAAAVAALVALVEPVIERTRRLTRIGLAGLWNEVADALGNVLAYQRQLPPDDELIAILDAAVRVPGVPWRSRPTLGATEVAGLGRIPLAQKGGCCLAYTEPRDESEEEPGSEPADPEARYCSTCSLRSEASCHAHQVAWFQDRYAGAAG